MDLRAIINWLLWRFAPAAWLEGKVAQLLSWAMNLLEDEDQRAWLDAHRRNAAWFGGWLAVIEARLDELIDLRAHQLLNWRWDPREVPAHHHAYGVRSASDGFDRLMRLLERFAGAERLAHRRAGLLARFAEERRFSFLADHTPPPLFSSGRPHTEEARRASPSSAAAAFFKVASRRGRSSRIFENACGRYYVRIRAPPWRATIPEKHAAQPAALTCEIALSCLKSRP